MWDIVTQSSVEALIEQHYHERESHGYTDKSSLANLAEKCLQSGYVARKCDGIGCRAGLHETGEYCQKCHGTGWMTKKVKTSHIQSRTCPACKGSARELPRDREACAALFKHGRWEAVTRIEAPPCKRCKGTGHVPNFEVQPKTTQVFGVPQLEDLADKSSTVAEVMRQYQRRDAEGEHVLMLLFGAGGALRTSYLGKQYGREIALWKLTQSGSVIVRDELARDATLSFDRALVVASQRVNDTIRALASLADSEAKELKRVAMHGLWQLDEETGGHLSKEAHRRINRRSA